MGQQLVAELRDVDAVTHVREGNDDDLYIYTDGRHDRHVQRTLFKYNYRIVDISSHDFSDKGNVYIYAMSRSKAEYYLS